MTVYLRWGGAALLMIGAMAVSYAYEKYLQKRISEYRGLVSLLDHAEREITKFLSYGSALWRGFQDDSLEKCGLLPILREGKALCSAFEAVSDKMSLSSSAKKRLAEDLARLGRGYKDGELTLIGSIKQSLSEELESESVEAEKNIKVARALLLGGALAVVIMVV